MDKFDILLQKHPLSVPVRDRLARDTLETIVQVKRARLARRMLIIVFAIIVLLLITKWLSNDIFYLMQLLFYKFTVVKSQSALYLAALLESFPKLHLLTLVVLGILWLGWRKFETFLLHSRITSTKKGILMTTIKMTPRLVIANTLIVITALGVAGYGYAQKTQQEKLQL